jgi:hypothetical protein
MALTLGILVVGSLYWDDQPNRQAWRRARLEANADFHVNVPIRYGRKAETRGDTYTMVFSRSCPVGQAKVIQCKNLVESADDLVAEAERLWAAERSAPESNHHISASWGAVALLIHPGVLVPRPLLDTWAQRVSREHGYGTLRHTREDGPPVSEAGLLQIAWPSLVEGCVPLSLDLLLATATDPTLEGDPPSFPSPETIAAAWNADALGNVRYFFSNQRNGIATFQDKAILAHLVIRRDLQ